MSQYLDQYTAYMFELPTVEAVQDKQLEVTMAFESGKMDTMVYNDKMKALLILEQQHTDTEARRARWVNAGQVKNG